jgi:hypothetical protein
MPLTSISSRDILESIEIQKKLTNNRVQLVKKHFYPIALLILFCLNLASCSSMQSKDKADKAFSIFLSQPQHYAFFNPVSIESEEKLKVLGISDYGQRISQKYGIKDPVVAVIEKFIKATPPLSSTIIVQPENAKDLSLSPNDPVLFFHSDWHLIYRRIPPSFTMNQLQVGIVGKIIPLGQVLSDRGPMALKTSAWEGKCFFKAFDGKYLSLDDWEANNGDLLRQGIKDAQNYCAHKFISEFSSDTASSNQKKGD